MPTFNDFKNLKKNVRRFNKNDKTTCPSVVSNNENTDSFDIIFNSTDNAYTDPYPVTYDSYPADNVGPPKGITEQKAGTDDEDYENGTLKTDNTTPSTQQNAQNNGDNHGDPSNKRTESHNIIGGGDIAGCQSWTYYDEYEPIALSEYKNLTIEVIGGGGGAGGSGAGNGGDNLTGMSGGGGGGAAAWYGTISLIDPNVKFTNISNLQVGGGGAAGIGGTNADSGKPGYAGFNGDASILTFGINIGDKDYSYTLNAGGGSFGQGGTSGKSSSATTYIGGGVGGTATIINSDCSPSIMDNTDYWYSNLTSWNGSNGSNGNYNQGTSPGALGGESQIWSTDHQAPPLSQQYWFFYEGSDTPYPPNNYGSGGTSANGKQGSYVPNSWSGRMGVVYISGEKYPEPDPDLEPEPDGPVDAEPFYSPAPAYVTSVNSLIGDIIPILEEYLKDNLH